MFEQALENIEDALRKQADRTTELDCIEQTLLLGKNGIEAYIGREVLPHVPDAWYGQESVKVGYEVSFMCYSYRPQPFGRSKRFELTSWWWRRRPGGFSARSSEAG